MGTYTVLASHPTASPNWTDGVRPGRRTVEITVKPGDGKRPTLEDQAGGEVAGLTQQGSTGGSGGGEALQTKRSAKSLRKRMPRSKHRIKRSLKQTK